MTNDELKTTFLETAKAIKEKCMGESGDDYCKCCPFSLKDRRGGYCMFNWNNFYFPWEWTFDTEGKITTNNNEEVNE